MSKAIARLKDSYRVEVQSDEHVYIIDEPIDVGGTNKGPNPSQVVMGALGGCIAITMKMYAERKGWKVDEIIVNLDYDRFKGSEYPGYEGDENFVHEIRESITLKGDLDADQRARLFEIASKCPVRRLISSPAFFIEELIANE
ncbi:OsmC family protein [Anaerolineales bacterium]